MKQGFTLIEILVSLAALVVLSVLAISFFFLTLSQRDQAVAESTTADQAEAVFSLVGRAVKSAKTINVAGGGTRLELVGSSECWLFDWNQVDGELDYGRNQGLGCSLPAAADQRLTSQAAKVEEVNFSLVAPDDSSKTVEMKLSVAVYRPLWQSQQSFSQVFVNVVDGGGND